MINDSITEHPEQSHFLNSYTIPGGQVSVWLQNIWSGRQLYMYRNFKGKIFRETAMLQVYLKNNIPDIVSKQSLPTSFHTEHTNTQGSWKQYISWLHNFSHAFAYPCFNISCQEVYTAKDTKKKINIYIHIYIFLFKGCVFPGNFFFSWSFSWLFFFIFCVFSEQW